MIVQDTTNGTSAVLLGVSGGVSFGAGAGTGWHWSSADTVDQLTGWGGSFGGSIGIFGVEVIYGSGYFGLNLTLGIGMEYHSSATYTEMVVKREPWMARSHDNRYQFRDHYDSEAGMCK